MHAWSTCCLPEKVDPLLARLDHLDPTRIVVTRTPGKKRQLVEFYAETELEVLDLQKNLGGEIRAIPSDWHVVPSRPPVIIRDRFKIVETLTSPPDPKEIVIPAGLAFGTGDHPTTASCLRLLCDASKTFRGQNWSMLDVGTGSGVLAIVAKKLGAAKVAGFDYDPLSIRTAKENARENNTRDIQWSRQDLLAFAPAEKYEIVTANIFSELFLASWPQIQKSVASDGFFILSGILRFQAADCRAAIKQASFQIIREIKLGKWATFLAKKGL